MQKRRQGWFSKLIIPAVLVALGGTGTAFAATSSSPSYQMTETGFNAGTMQSCSDQYCARASIGEMATGQGSDGTTKAEFGLITSDEPLLEVIVDPGESNLGVLDTGHAATKTMIVRVRNYLSSGYVLQITGNPPKYGTHTLSTPSTPTASTPGTEQFAINVAANTSPSVGAVPVQVPSSQTSFGFASPDYATPNLFKYSSGETIARSNSESGRTDYTISMIVNISNMTPAGHYSGDFSAVVIPVY